MHSSGTVGPTSCFRPLLRQTENGKQEIGDRNGKLIASLGTRRGEGERGEEQVFSLGTQRNNGGARRGGDAGTKTSLPATGYLTICHSYQGHS